MKAFYLLLNLFFLFCFTACEKSENKDNNTISSFKAIKNDVNWISTGSWANFSKTEKRFFISGTKPNSEYYDEEQLFFSFYLADVPKSNTVSNFYSELSYIVGGDAISDSYQIDSTSNNSIQIMSIDTVEKQISGTFLIKLLRNKHWSNKSEIILFKEGQFSITYREID